MFEKIKRFIGGSEDLEAIIVKRFRSHDGSSFTVVFEEIGKLHPRSFKQTFNSFSPGTGHTAPKPTTGAKALVRVNRLGKVIYAGSSS